MPSIPNLRLAAPAELVAEGGNAPDLVVATAFEGEDPAVAALPPTLAAAFAALAGRAGWRGRERQRLEGGGGDGRPAVALHGLGRRGECRSRKLDRWLYQALDAAARNGLSRVAVVLPDHPALGGEGAAAWLARAAVRATYRFDRFQSRREGEGPGRLAAVDLLLPGGADEGAQRRLAAVAAGLVLCRDLDNTPANEADPAWMAARARELAEAHGMEYRCLEPAELAERGMGGILAVGSGSAAGPRLVRLEWGTRGPVLALVGKGVTFDTGGISIKPAGDMDEMKYDKSGACTVLGIARAVAELDLPVRLRVYAPLAENMPDGAAYRPGDIVRCYNGKTVEIVNTDAEGRMILADALAWAAEEGPDALLEYSTLTGACVVALGQEAAGLYSPDDDLAGGLLAAAEGSGERLWRLPLWPEFVERMKGSHADLKNSGGRWGGANTAAAFLSEFVGPLTRWAHLDIAGAAYVGRQGDEEPGATGYGVPFTVEWLRRWSASSPSRG